MGLEISPTRGESALALAG